LSIRDVLYAISEARLALTASKTEDTLKVYSAAHITPELAAAWTRWGMRFVGRGR
jgi:hypothetical protein